MSRGAARGGTIAWPLVGLVLACGPSPAGDGSTAPERGAAAGESMLGRRVGEVLALAVPLLGGGHLELAELRGRRVLLDLGDARSPDRDEAQARYRALVERHGDALAVVCVGLDAELADLPAGWTDAPPPFVLGWDPQGALAARLGLVVLPTVVLLDEQGRIVDVHEGTSPDDATIDRWLGQGMAGLTHA